MEMPGLTFKEVEDTDTEKNCFDISNGVDHWLLSCHSKEDHSSWLSELQEENAKPASPRAPKEECPPALPPHRSFTGNGSSIASDSKSSLLAVAGGAPSRGSVLCLRPSPPTRFVCSQDVVAKKKSKKSDWKPDDKSFEDDALILKVVEAYCSSAKSRNTLNPGVEYPQVLIAEEEKIIVEKTEGDEVIVEEKSLVDTVYGLRDDLSDLKKDVGHIRSQLVEERSARKQMELVLSTLQSRLEE